MSHTHTLAQSNPQKKSKVDFGDYLFYPNESGEKPASAPLKFKQHDLSEDSYVMRRHFRHIAQNLRNRYS